jgi:hypothetical protein
VDTLPTDNNAELVDLLRRDLLQRYGPMVGDDDLRAALGYKSMDALRQGLARKTVPVPVFSVPHRRGKFALVQDIAAWLAERRDAAALEMGARNNEGEGK